MYPARRARLVQASVQVMHSILPRLLPKSALRHPLSQFCWISDQCRFIAGYTSSRSSIMCVTIATARFRYISRIPLRVLL